MARGRKCTWLRNLLIQILAANEVAVEEEDLRERGEREGRGEADEKKSVSTLNVVKIELAE